MKSNTKYNHLSQGGFFLKSFAVILFIGIVEIGCAQSFKLQTVYLNNENRYRGLSVVNDSLAWISGSKGSFGVTIDGGKNWKVKNIKNYDSVDFRSIYAWNEKKAIVASAGQPCVILKTEDGGLSWKKVYENTNPASFLDAIDFYDEKNGVALGDPLNDKMMLLFTKDGGMNWKMDSINAPQMFSEESAFAASGTSIQYVKNGDLFFVSGGKKARLFYRKNKNNVWKSIATPFVQGQMGQGIFSFCELENESLFLVGGDFKDESLKTNNAFIWKNNQFTRPQKSIGGYRECVIQVANQTLIAVGPSGIDASFDSGNNWQEISSEKNFNAARKARKGQLILLSGKGKIGILRKD